MMAEKKIASVKPILDTHINTFTLDAQSTGTVDQAIMYISAVLKDGKEVRLKPLSFKNIECLKNSKQIYENKIIVGIQKKPDGLYLKLREDKVKLFPHKILNLTVECGKEVVSLGLIKGMIPYTIENYKNYDDIYGMFLIFAKKALANQKK